MINIRLWHFSDMVGLRLDVGMTIKYKAYDIDPFEGDPGQWRARITRLDGKKIKVAVPPSEHVFLDTSPRVSEEEAAKLAKQGIVGGGMD
jgi:hypothetical protein